MRKSRIAAFTLLVSLLSSTTALTASSEKLRVTASFYPLAHFAEQVGGDLVEVINITPAGVEPHAYEPTPKDIMKVRSAKVFLFNGGNLDPWAERIQADLGKKGILVAEMMEHFELFKEYEEGEEKEHEKDVYEDDHDHGEFDPHIWLDPILVRKEIQIIQDAFITADPQHADEYRKNSAEYINKLAELHNKYKEGLKTCKIRGIVVNHDAFSYLAKRYNLEPLSLAGLSPIQEPSPRRMAEIVKIARKKKIKHIFFETLVSPKVAETIAREIGAQILVLNPVSGLTGEEIKTGKTYISIMEENLHNFRVALACK